MVEEFVGGEEEENKHLHRKRREIARSKTVCATARGADFAHHFLWNPILPLAMSALNAKGTGA